MSNIKNINFPHNVNYFFYSDLITLTGNNFNIIGLKLNGTKYLKNAEYFKYFQNICAKECRIIQNIFQRKLKIILILQKIFFKDMEYNKMSLTVQLRENS